jgi:xanthine dehydrogenase iron-sulfur cluster and FAD-binding subunit A
MRDEYQRALQTAFDADCTTQSAANDVVVEYDLPEGSDLALSAAQAHTTEELQALLGSLHEAHGDEIEAVAEEMKPCEYRATQHYEEFILRELLDRALLELRESDALDGVVASDE